MLLDEDNPYESFCYKHAGIVRRFTLCTFKRFYNINIIVIPVMIVLVYLNPLFKICYMYINTYNYINGKYIIAPSIR